MWLTIVLVFAFFLAPALAILSVYRKTKNTNKKVAGYVYNGEDWVTWLLFFCVLAALFLGFVLPFVSEQPLNRPDWNGLKVLLVSILLYLCYAVIAFVRATDEQFNKSKAAGKTVLDRERVTSSSKSNVVWAAIGAFLSCIPEMISNALNPAHAVKTVGNKVYKKLGAKRGQTIGGVIGLSLVVVLAFALIMLTKFSFAFVGTVALWVIAVVKFVMNFKK